MEKIIIYTNEQCPYCKEIKEVLDKNNIEFKERLTKDWVEKWQDITSLTGMPTVPTIYFKINYFVPSRDFNNVQHLINILNNFEESKFSNEQQTFEKLKTLNHNINIAFGKTDQLLRQIETNTKKDEHKSTS